MVLAERHAEMMRNGRSRGSSPNGHNGGGGGGSPDTSSDDENSLKRNGKSKSKSEFEEKIRVGRDYQAVCPEIIPVTERKPELLNDRALLVWSPTKEIPDSRLEDYITVAKEKYGYNGEQALGMLFWHKHDLERAVMDLANFTPFPDEWTVEDKVLFEQAFHFHGKSFHRIRQMLPDKSIASLVKYYYSWKKTRNRQSVMDRQEKAKASKDGSENGSDNGSNEDSDNNDEKDQNMASSFQETKSSVGGNSYNTCGTAGSISGGGSAVSGSTSGQINTDSNRQTNNSNKRLMLNAQQITTSQSNDTNLLNNAAGISATSTTISANSVGLNNANGGSCTGCGVPCNQLHATLNNGKLCNSCHHHWRRTGIKRPTSGPFGKRYRDRNTERHKRKPPRGMYINHDDIVALANQTNSNQEDELLANTEREIVSLLSQVQQNKQNISTLKKKVADNSEDLKLIESNSRLNSRWSNEELLMAVQGVRKFGKQFQAIADTIGTKTEAHIRTFFVNYRRRYNLDNVLKVYEEEQEKGKQSPIEDTLVNKDFQQKNNGVVEITGGSKYINSQHDQNQTISNATTDLTKQNLESVIMEIDLDSETSQPSPPKKATIVPPSVNQDTTNSVSI